MGKTGGVNIPCGFDRRARGLFGGPCFFRRPPMRTVVYVDGFNLFYGTLRGTPWRWLDLVALFEKVLQPQHDIAGIRFEEPHGKDG
ncbi:MAG: NYN domain-containing protein [Alphaproteobacteria bacterium]|nr:NYN domain-containing protein [Alphaproteobacteria bacterium]